MNKQTVQLLEQHFETAFAASNGIAKLCELVLTLARQGKRIEKDSNDPPAKEEKRAERRCGTSASSIPSRKTWLNCARECWSSYRAN